MRSVAQLWINTPSSSAIDAENISVSISPGRKMPVQNPILIILVTIIARIAWIICFFAEIAAGTEQEEAAFLSWVISVKNVRENSKFEAQNLKFR